MTELRFAVAILLALTMPAGAEDRDSANFFLPGCKDTTPKHGGKGNAPDLLTALCMEPNGATSGQARAVVVKYIEARTERMHEHFGLLAIEAMQAAWPCKR